MKTVATTPDGDREIARRINALHAEAEQHRSRCCDAVYDALRAAWQAGHLLLKQKSKIVHGNWELWLDAAGELGWQRAWDSTADWSGFKISSERPRRNDWNADLVATAQLIGVAQRQFALKVGDAFLPPPWTAATSHS